MRKTTVTSILAIAGAALGAALVGLLGAYFILPQVAPGLTSSTASEQQVPSDSASRSQPDTARRASPAASAPPSLERSDSASGASRPRSARGPSPAVSTRSDTARSPAAQALRDSIAVLHRRLRTAQEVARSLQQDTSALRTRLSAAETRRAKVNELSDALMDMRRRGLTSLLKEVKMSVLKALYRQTTGSARTRLLQSMEPARAARFINQVVEQDAAEPAPIAPDSALASE